MYHDLFAPIVKAYIDPGTGSMLFTVLISLISAVIYALRGIVIRMRYSSKKNIKSSLVKDKKQFVIYSDSKRYWNVFYPIIREFISRKMDIYYYTQSEDDPCFKEKSKYLHAEFIGSGNKAFIKMNMLSANVILSTTPGLDVYQWKRSKDVNCYVHIPHALDNMTMYRMFGIDYYDAIILNGDYQVDQIRDMENLRGLPNKDLRVLGCPYFDELRKKELRKEPNENTVVLLAPSWGENGILRKYGETLIDELLNTGYRIIIRPHPQSFVSEKSVLEILMKKYPNIEWNRDNDNFNVLNKSDILISDFSGIIFDYALIFEKPILYNNTSFDFSPYDQWWLKGEPWTFSKLTEIGKSFDKKDIGHMKDIINESLSDKNYKQRITLLKNQMWKNQGNSTRDIVDYLIVKSKEGNE